MLEKFEGDTPPQESEEFHANKLAERTGVSVETAKTIMEQFRDYKQSIIGSLKDDDNKRAVELLLDSMEAPLYRHEP